MTTRLTVLLGSKMNLPGCKRGEWKMTKDRGQDGKDWEMTPGETTIEVTEKVADGLIALAKQWEHHNRRREVKGDLRRMVKVKDVQRNVSPDPEKKFAVVGMDALQKFAETLGDRLTENMQALATSGNDAGGGKPKGGRGSSSSGS